MPRTRFYQSRLKDDSSHLAKDKGDAERPQPEILEWWTHIFELPCVAIGGITPENCAPLIAAGADFLAVSGAVWNGDEAKAVRSFVEVLEGHG